MPSPRAVAALVAVVVVAACGGGHHSQTATTTTPTTAASLTTDTTVTTGAASPTVTAGPAPTTALAEWPTYHGSASRSGSTPGGPSGATAPRLAWQASVPGAVYAQPVAAGGLVVVASERDVVVGLDARTGATRWSTSLGTPVDGSSLPCGDISPSGITSTPVIDPTNAIVHVVAFVAGSDGPHHDLVALRLASGAVLSRVAADPPGLDPTVEQQRGALALANGRVYIPYGDLFGDCGNYKGAIVSFPANATSPETSWITSASSEAGLWSPPGPTVATDGSLWVATGNGGSKPGGGNSVVHLDASLHQIGTFSPPNSLAESQSDQDLGSSSPMLVGGVVAQAGKPGDLYLIEPSRLTEVGAVHVCDGVYGGAATSGGVLYLPCQGDGVTAVTIEGSSASVRWHTRGFRAGGPVVVGGSVWVIDVDGGDLLAVDPVSGAIRSTVHIGRAAHFATPGVADGRLVVATMSGSVKAFGA